MAADKGEAMITVRQSPDLLRHLETFEVDGATVASLLFEGGRLAYPGRKQLEHELGYIEPYTLELEARTIEGLPKSVSASIRMLANNVPFAIKDIDPTLEVLWSSHAAWSRNGISLDRLVAALVMIEELQSTARDRFMDSRGILEDAATMLVRYLHSQGLPPTLEGLEELFDGAFPACVGLGLVDL